MQSGARYYQARVPEFAAAMRAVMMPGSSQAEVFSPIETIGGRLPVDLVASLSEFRPSPAGSAQSPCLLWGVRCATWRLTAFWRLLLRLPKHPTLTAKPACPSFPLFCRPAEGAAALVGGGRGRGRGGRQTEQPSSSAPH